MSIKPPTLKEMQNRLDNFYRTDSKEYIEHVEMFKGLGYRVFRNKDGIHKLQINEKHLEEFFGGAFKGVL